MLLSVSVFRENMPCSWAGTMKTRRPCTLCPGSPPAEGPPCALGGQQLALSCFVLHEFPQEVAGLPGGLVHCHQPLLLRPQHQFSHILLTFLPRTRRERVSQTDGEGWAQTSMMGAKELLWDE